MIVVYVVTDCLLFSWLILVADKEMTYDHLAAGLKEVLQNDKSAFDADRLQKYTGTIMNVLFFPT